MNHLPEAVELRARGRFGDEDYFQVAGMAGGARVSSNAPSLEEIEEADEMAD